MICHLFFCRQRKRAFAIILNNTMLDVIMIIHNGKACSYGQIYKLQFPPPPPSTPFRPHTRCCFRAGLQVQSIKYEVYGQLRSMCFIFVVSTKQKFSVTTLIAEHVRATMDNIQTKSVEKKQRKNHGCSAVYKEKNP